MKTCPAIAFFGSMGPQVKCERSPCHTGLCGGHDGSILWVWGTLDEGEELPEEP